MGNVYLENEALIVENMALVGIVQSQQSEIARLQAELERLRKLTLTLSTDRHVPAMRVAYEMHKKQAQASDDYMALLSRFDTARNDALEEVAQAADAKYGGMIDGQSIRALKDKS